MFYVKIFFYNSVRGKPRGKKGWGSDGRYISHLKTMSEKPRKIPSRNPSLFCICIFIQKEDFITRKAFKKLTVGQKGSAKMRRVRTSAG